MRKKLDEMTKTTVFEKSFFLKYIYAFTNWVYVLIVNGLFGKLFTSHSEIEKHYQKSFFYVELKKLNLIQKIRKRLKFSVAQSFENSGIINGISNFGALLLKRRLKEYGIVFSIVGALGLLIYMLEGGSFYVFFRDPISIISCVAFIVLGFSLVVSKKTLSESIFESRIISELLFEGVGIQKDIFDSDEADNKGYLITVLVGLVFGALTYFVSPIYYVVFMIVVLAAALIIMFPELGIVGSFAIISVASYFPRTGITLLLVVGITLISYIIKLVRGKRVFKFGFFDFVLLSFVLVRFLSGVMGAGGKDSFYQAVFSCGLLTAYFLVVNLIRSRGWLKRSVVVFVAFAGVSAIIGIFQIFIGGFESGWLDSSVFPGITVRVSSTFDNPNNYAAYLLLVIPFVISGLLESKILKRVAFYVAVLIMTMLCMVQTWSRGAWIGLCVSVVIFFLIYSARSLPFVAAGGASIVLGVSFFAPNVSQRFASIGNLAESSISYRMSIWRGTLDMLRYNWIGGIGFGEASFAATYPAFAYSGAEVAKHAHSLYLQIMTESGIIGLLLFLLTVILFAQHCFEYLYSVKLREGRGVVVAGLSSMAGILVMGLTDYVWYNSRVYLAFWLVMGVVNACIRIGYFENERLNDIKKNSIHSVDIEIDSENAY